MKKKHKILIVFTLIAVFILVYRPHFNYPLPLHIDEWHHLSEALRMENYGEYFEMLRSTSAGKFFGLEIGFHFFLFLISWLFDLTAIYQFLPALWAVFSALAIFYVAYKKTNKNFWLAWLTIIFFASIRSNVNLTGLWFFTPLTFSLPLIYLYTYFISEGLEKHSKKQLLAGLAIILILIPTHSISFLFSLPAFLIYLLLKPKYLLKEYKFFLIFSLIPLAGILFFKYVLAIPSSRLIFHLFNSLQFKYGWGVLELHNSLTEVYSWTGYILAIVGLIFIIKNQKTPKYLFYILWPLTVVVLILLYKLSGISFLSPYQRNLYYFVLALPLFSAIGLYALIKMINRYLEKIFGQTQGAKVRPKFTTLTWKLKINEQDADLIQFLTKNFITLLIFIITLVLVFGNYYKLPPTLGIYHVIEARHYQALKFLTKFPPTTVMATPFVSTALYPITKHRPVGAVMFYGKKQEVELFFLTTDCAVKNELLEKHRVKYIISPLEINCGYNLIYAENKNYIYQVK